MKLGWLDYALARLTLLAPGMLSDFGDLETRLLKGRLSAIEVDRPIFIAGLARSGTTTLLGLLAGAEGVATHRYRDFPLVFAPYFWQRFQDRFATAETPVERPHRDRILITKESPEAFEEPIWQHFFPGAHDARADHVIAAGHRNPDFEDFFVDHIKKILAIRGGRRYLSKGNYNISRIGYLAEIFPDARFVIPVRHPFAQVKSLARQHEIFLGYTRQDPRVPTYLRAAGHYEFGPQRVPINFGAGGAPRLRGAWQSGDEALGYAILWSEAYRHADRLRRDAGLDGRVMVLRYEDLCGRPEQVVRELLAFVGLEREGVRLLDDLGHIRAPDAPGTQPPEQQREAIWREVEPVARLFDYEAGAPAS